MNWTARVGWLLWMLVSLPIVSEAAAPQYRHLNQTITAARSDEPVRENFSVRLLQQHVDKAPALWARQKQCISCHTHGIYLYVRPQLTRYWGQPATEVRKFLLQQVTKRINEGDTDDVSARAQLAYMSRGLAAFDAANGKTTSTETDLALRSLLNDMQARDGSINARYRFPPINSDTWHATVMAAIAFGTAPGWYPSLPDGETKSAVQRLLNYLKETPPKHDHQKLLLLWASTHWPELLSPKQVTATKRRIWELQRPDGGWSVRSFAEPEKLGNVAKARALRAEPDFANPSSDGYQTALAIIVLRDVGVSAADPRLQNAVKWLKTNQRESGRWWTKSLNTSSRFHYISYSGTAYAALALAKCGELSATNP